MDDRRVGQGCFRGWKSVRFGGGTSGRRCAAQGRGIDGRRTLCLDPGSDEFVVGGKDPTADTTQRDRYGCRRIAECARVVQPEGPSCGERFPADLVPDNLRIRIERAVAFVLDREPDEQNGECWVSAIVAEAPRVRRNLARANGPG